MYILYLGRTLCSGKEFCGDDNNQLLILGPTLTEVNMESSLQCGRTVTDCCKQNITWKMVILNPLVC